MTQLTEEQKKQIEEFAGLFFSQDDIVIIMELDASEFNGSRFDWPDFRVPYQRGKLLKEAEFRKKVFSLAVAGSSPAQLIVKDLIKDSILLSISV